MILTLRQPEGHQINTMRQQSCAAMDEFTKTVMRVVDKFVVPAAHLNLGTASTKCDCTSSVTHLGGC